jgi:predicted metal-dependent hydrolase
MIFGLLKKEKLREELEVEGVKFKLNIYYENRRSSRASFGVKSINIRIPYFLTRNQKEKELNKLKNWVIKKISQNIEHFQKQKERVYHHDEHFQIGDHEYILKIKHKDKKTGASKLIQNEIHILLPKGLSEKKEQAEISSLLSQAVGRERLPALKERINHLNNRHFQGHVNKISFRHQKARWGSCTSQGNISISTRLLFAPDDVLEYVCVHELAHLIHMNHSKKFWNLVEEVIPDYKTKKKWLRVHGEKCFF